MEFITDIVTFVNNILWSYVLIATLIACGLWFTFKTKFVQFRMIGHMFKLLLETGTDKIKGNKKLNNEKKERKISLLFLVIQRIKPLLFPLLSPQLPQLQELQPSSLLPSLLLLRLLSFLPPKHLQLLLS